LHTDSFAQRITAKYIELFDLEAHIQKIKAVYRARREIMMQCINDFFPSQVKHSSPEGGLFIWVELPAHINTDELFVECINHNVAFVPGGSFFPNNPKKNTFRLNYSNMPEDRIVEGMKRLGAVLKQAVQQEAAVK
jgi:2-aminoadipate transaminase